MTAQARTDIPTTAEARGIDVVGYHDLNANPAFKVAMQETGGRWYLYLSHFWVNGWSVLDVTDPASPEYLRFIEGPEHTWTLQVQVAEGKMITSLERPSPGWGHDETKTKQTGVQIWDVATDPGDPRLLSYYDTTGRGTHRNHYAGGRYAYLASQPEGYIGNILIILDLEDPTNPKEVGRWWWPGQWAAGGENAEHQHYLHGPAYVVGDLAYLSDGGAGMVILDVSDPATPRFVGRGIFGDFGSNLGCHTAVLYGSQIVVANSEALAEEGMEPLGFAVTIDVDDPTAPRILGWLPTPQPSPDTGFNNYAEKGGRFGPHNQHHYQGQECLLDDPNKVHLTYFNAGLRIYDISDPRRPEETAYWVPEDPVERRGTKPEGKLVTQTEDVIVDSRGYIYCTDKNHGLFILRETEA